MARRDRAGGRPRRGGRPTTRRSSSRDSSPPNCHWSGSGYPIDIISNKKLDQKVVEFLNRQDYSLVENFIYRSTFLLKAYKMIFTYNQVKARPKLLLAMTDLTQGEYDQLLLHFHHAWDQFVRQNYVDRANRQRQYGGRLFQATVGNLTGKTTFFFLYI